MLSAHSGWAHRFADAAFNDWQAHIYVSNYLCHGVFEARTNWGCTTAEAPSGPCVASG